MTAPTLDAFTAGQALAHVLAAHGIDYAIGGALALGVWSDPRGTLVVDINLFTEPQQAADALDLLVREGVTLDRAAALRAIETGDSVLARYRGLRVDLFLPSIPFSHEAGRTRRFVSGPEGEIAFLSPGALAVFKLLFFRGKDLVDLEKLVAVHGPALDTACIRRWMVEMMGEEDERVLAWDGIVAAAGPDTAPPPIG
jgi:hypothetical protein